MALISNGTTVASGGSVTVSSSAVATATAGISTNAVGSYALIYRGTWSNTNSGSTFNNDLQFSNCSPSTNNNAASGTWRLMGITKTGAARSNSTVMLRIS